MVGGDVEGIDPLGLHVAEEVQEVPAIRLDRVVGEQRIADPGDQRPGGGGGVGTGGGQGLGQEGFDLGGGGSVPLEEVAPLGDERHVGRSGLSVRRRQGREVGVGVGRVFRHGDQSRGRKTTKNSQNYK